MLKLSIITVNLNNSDGLYKTIKSVVDQFYFNYEYIVIDGYSNDGSIEVIKEFADKIDYWVSEPDNGIYNAMNKGLKQATGDIITFLNSGDNYCTPHSLETAIECIKEKINLAELFFFDYIYKSGTSQKLISSSDVINKFVISKKGFGHSSTFYRKTLFESLGPFEENFKISADRVFYMKAIVQHKIKFAYISFPVSVFHYGGVSSDIQYRNILMLEDSEIINKYYTSLEKRLLDSRVIRRLFSIKVLNKIIITLLGWKLNRI